jgi:hypothetical protein
MIAELAAAPTRVRWSLPPAIRAMLVQAAAAVPTAASIALCAHWQHPLPAYGAALLQGALAALLTLVCGLAVWWRWIQIVFPIALVGAQTLHPPPAMLFAAFVVLTLLFWSTFRTQVPFYPSGPAAWRTVAELLPADRPIRLIDIGSGLGGLPLAIARRFPAATPTGIEVAPLPWLFSVLRARLTGSTARFVRGDYERLDFADYDVVFAYLSPAAMPALGRKAAREMRPSTMLVSYEFAIPGKPPDTTVAVTPSGPAMYVWHF